MEYLGTLESQAGTKAVSQVASPTAKISTEEQPGQGDTALLLDPGHSRWHGHHWTLDTAEALPRLRATLGTTATEHLMPPPPG